MTNYYPSLLPSYYYHIFNRGNNRENVFYRPDNVAFFLQKYLHYIAPVADTFAYCLLPNHFHVLIRVKTIEELQLFRQDLDPDLYAVSNLVSNQFRLLFMSYAKAINVQESRTGSLFQKNFKRLLISDDAHLINLVQYIHTNPQLHGLCGDFRDWTDSSLPALLSNRPTQLRRDTVLEWFGGLSNFTQQHNAYIQWKTSANWLVEDD